MAGSITGRNAPIPGEGSASFGAAPNMPKATDLPALQHGPIRDLSGRARAGGFDFVWTNLPVVFNLPIELQTKLREARDRALPRIQEDMVEWAKEYAPWRDVTGDARAELNSPAITKTQSGDVTIVLAHGVAYGVHLETMDGGRHGIIAKAIDEFAQRVPQYIAEELR